MKIVAGLGNPGQKYEKMRHNLGFMTIEALVQRWGWGPVKKEHKSFTYGGHLGEEKLLLSQPQTYMNLSGQALYCLAHFYKVEISNILIVHDEIELPFGRLKIQYKRGHGGHNGVRDIHEKLGSPNYYRLRMGVGRPQGNQPVDDYVLSPFSQKEQELLPSLLQHTLNGVERWVSEGYEKAADIINGWSLTGPFE